MRHEDILRARTFDSRMGIFLCQCMIKQLVGLFQNRATVLTTYIFLLQALRNMSHPSISCFDLFTRRMYENC